MKRPTVSVVIPAWNEWGLTRACLESLRPTLGPRDEVIVVDNGSVDGTAARLRRYSWARVISHAENTGFAAGCNSGAALARSEVVLFLNNDTLLPARWLDGLLRPFQEPTVGATGPRSNFASGAQLVGNAAYDPGRVSSIQRFARGWRAEHRGQTTEVTGLIGFCVAVRREAFEALGGFDEEFGLGGHEDDDLCLRLGGAGYRLLIAHESFVHHHGHRTFDANEVDWYALQQRNGQLLRDKHPESGVAAAAAAGGAAVGNDEVELSACLIVRDEADNLPRCLDSLRGVVDEIVIYDTGSVDGTVELARAAGATVVEGYWDDDFGRARNEALARCRGRWILHVDADEVVETDAAALRAELLISAGVDTLGVRIDNIADGGDVGVSHSMVRLFQRRRARWEGRLHEHVVPRRAGAVLTMGNSGALRLTHYGYTSEAMRRRGKVERNLRAAQADAGVDGVADPVAVLQLGRALRSAGRLDEAVERFARVRQLEPPDNALRQALRFGVETLVEAGRGAEALDWVRELRRRTSSTQVPDHLEALARFNLGDTFGAAACLDRITAWDDIRDEDMQISPHTVALHRGRVFAAVGRWEEAVGGFEVAVRSREVPDDAWQPMVEAYWRTDRSLEPLLATIDQARLMPLLGQLLKAPAEAADAAAEVLWRRFSGDPQLLAFAIQVGPHRSVNRALEWSARLRRAGLEEQCPLTALAASAARSPFDRLSAAAVAFEAFGDDRGREAIAAAGAVLAPDDFGTALLALNELSPRLLPDLVTGAATSPERCLALAGVLRQLGAEEEAAALTAHAAA